MTDLHDECFCRVIIILFLNIYLIVWFVWDGDQDNKCLNNWATSTSYYNLFNAYIL